MSCSVRTRRRMISLRIAASTSVKNNSVTVPFVIAGMFEVQDLSDPEDQETVLELVRKHVAYTDSVRGRCVAKPDPMSANVDGAIVFHTKALPPAAMETVKFQ